MIEKTKPGIIHMLAVCQNCEKRWENYKTADTEARQHAKATGHTVNVECGSCWTYNPR